MTRLFYEKHVPKDRLLATLFGNMAADHPQRVAKWLAEVFGVPKDYSERYGGYTRMISQHAGKRITEEHRARWVAALLQSAREAGLPNDPEFRSVFQSYVEWGSRPAVEYSQSNAHPPPNMPMPHWEWNTAAGPPGSRISALVPQAEEPEQQAVLPGPDEPVTFEVHVKSLFRPRDRGSMQFAFECATNVRRGDAVGSRLSMQCSTEDGGLMALRDRPMGDDSKPPHAALVSDRRGERCGHGARDASGGDYGDDRC